MDVALVEIMNVKKAWPSSRTCLESTSEKLTVWPRSRAFAWNPLLRGWAMAQ